MAIVVELRIAPELAIEVHRGQVAIASVIVACPAVHEVVVVSDVTMAVAVPERVPAAVEALQAWEASEVAEEAVVVAVASVEVAVASVAVAAVVVAVAAAVEVEVVEGGSKR